MGILSACQGCLSVSQPSSWKLTLGFTFQLLWIALKFKWLSIRSNTVNFFFLSFVRTASKERLEKLKGPGGRVLQWLDWKRSGTVLIESSQAEFRTEPGMRRERQREKRMRSQGFQSLHQLTLNSFLSKVIYLHRPIISPPFFFSLSLLPGYNLCHCLSPNYFQ